MVTAAPARGVSLRILVTDAIISRFESALRRGGEAHEWVMAAGWPEAEVLAAAGEAEVVVGTTLTPAMAAAAPRLRLVHSTGAGVDRIALDALAPGVAVASTSHHAGAMAEHVVMVCLMLSRRVQAADRELRQGSWRTIATDQAVPFHRLLRGTTMGVIGLGSIGAEVARVASALGMRVRAVRRRPDAPLPRGVRVEWVGPLERVAALAAESDFLVVAAPLADATRGLVGRDAIEAMKPDACLINVARGPVVDQDALAEALGEHRIGGAALDVWWGAPGPGTTAPPSVARFAALDRVLLTPHHSSHAREVFELRARDIADNIARLAAGDALVRVVRPVA